MTTELEVKDLIDATGRLQFSRLVAYARSVSREIFIRQFRHPLLMGSALLSGKLAASVELNKTISFNVALLWGIPMQREEANQRTSLKRAIYPLIKVAYGNSPANVYTIGRMSKNDLVMADFTVSRRHAQIRSYYGKYFVMDLNAHNGTRVNGRLLRPEVEHVLNKGDAVSFGRYEFIFMDAGFVHDQLQKR